MAEVRCTGIACLMGGVVLALASGVAAAQDDEEFDFLFGDGSYEEPSDGSSSADNDSEDESASSDTAAEAGDTAESSDQQSDAAELEPEPTDTIDVPSTQARAPAGRRGRVLEEIVVTAQKREQNLTDVPISVSAITGDKLRDAGIENLSDLSEYAPNFKLVEGGLVPLIYLRGVGSGSNQGFELSVGMYNDGIHLGRPHQTLAAFYGPGARRGAQGAAVHPVRQERDCRRHQHHIGQADGGI